MSKYYAGIGSRQTPLAIQAKMTEVSRLLHKRGYTLSSGGAKGADTAFEVGTDRKRIFYARHGNNKACQDLAEKFHPNWKACNAYARALHGRNMKILLGGDLKTPVAFVLCWTKDGKATGGTGQALRAAEHYQIPVINMFNDSWETQLQQEISK